MKSTNPSRNTEAAKGTQPDNAPSLIDRAESLRESLQTALADTRNLITTLKQQQETSRSVQSALKSLRQLEALEV
jgi:signal transduction histidine kinase